MIIKKLLNKILNQTFFISLLFSVVMTAGISAQLNSKSQVEWDSLAQGCDLSDIELSKGFKVYGVDAANISRRLSYPIDNSGNKAGQIDVIVNLPSQPVILILGHYNPAVWKIQMTEDTQIAGVIVYGYHRQEVAGLTADTPILINTFDKCREDDYYKNLINRNLSASKQLSEKLFGQKLDRWLGDINSDPSDRLYILGEPLEEDTILISSEDTPVESFLMTDAPRVGHAGIEGAVKKGMLRPATQQDFDTWASAYIQNRESSSKKELFPTAEKREHYKNELIKSFKDDRKRTYVVLDDNFEYPAGLSESLVFLVNEGVSLPKGDSGHSAVFDSQGNSLTWGSIFHIKIVDGRAGIITAPEAPHPEDSDL